MPSPSRQPQLPAQPAQQAYHTANKPSQCPRCKSPHFRGHGSFPLKDGSRLPRYRCHQCHRTFSAFTGTPVERLRKRHLWDRLAQCMDQCLSLRKTAAFLGIHLETAFRWRHRCLADLDHQPQPVLDGIVAAFPAHIRYSEKGSRKTHGPGSWGYYEGVSLPRFRRLIHGRPSYVLFLANLKQVAAVITGQGRPDAETLERSLAPRLGSDVRLWIHTDILPSAPACCRRMGLEHEEPPRRQRTARHVRPHWKAQVKVEVLAHGLYAFLKRFRGVATRYLQHYLSWYLYHEGTPGLWSARWPGTLTAATAGSPTPGR